MPNIQLDNFPDDLYARLQAAAQAHHRGINDEILHCIAVTLGSHSPDPQKTLATARRLRAQTAARVLTEHELQAAKQMGRE